MLQKVQTHTHHFLVEGLGRWVRGSIIQAFLLHVDILALVDYLYGI